MADLLDTTFSSPPLHSDPKLLRDPLLDVPISRFAYDQNFKKTDDFIQVTSALETYKRLRLQAIEDLRVLEALRESFVANPIEYLHNHLARQAQNPDGSVYPPRLHIPDPPVVVMEKYEQLMDREADVYEDEYGVSSRPPAANISVGKWTQEEQAKLDRLLIEYPDEGVAQARWEKIASALGTRTAKQVAARVFRQMQRMEKGGTSSEGGRTHRGKKRKASALIKGIPKPKLEEITAEDIARVEAEDPDVKMLPYPRGSVEYDAYVRWKVHISKKRKNEVHIDPTSYRPEPTHYGISCSSCHKDPIVGNRWKCITCPSDAPVNLCQMCIGTTFTTDVHTPNHEFVCLSEPETAPYFVDSDYNEQHTDDYAYLRSDFMPT